MKILTIGDGFAAGHMWPMWPTILQLCLKNSKIVSLGKPAAGNEYIYTKTLEAINENTYDLVLVQWTRSNRLDLLLDGRTELNTIIESDSVYKHTVYDDWWLTSASQTDYVKQYHSIITPQQHQLRTINYILGLESTLTVKKIPFAFFSTYDLDFTSHKLANSINWNHWAWHDPFKGMHSYSNGERFDSVRTPVHQPTPPVQYQYLIDVIGPKVGLDLTNEKIKNLLYTKQWS